MPRGKRRARKKGRKRGGQLEGLSGPSFGVARIQKLVQRGLAVRAIFRLLQQEGIIPGKRRKKGGQRIRVPFARL